MRYPVFNAQKSPLSVPSSWVVGHVLPVCTAKTFGIYRCPDQISGREYYDLEGKVPSIHCQEWTRGLPFLVSSLQNQMKVFPALKTKLPSFQPS